MTVLKLLAADIVLSLSAAGDHFQNLVLAVGYVFQEASPGERELFGGSWRGEIHPQAIWKISKSHPAVNAGAMPVFPR